MRFNAGAFDSWLANIGQTYAWRKSSACPCVNPHSGAASLSCPHCFGRGRIWQPPINGVAGIAGSKTQLQWAQFGQWQNGDIVVTIPSNTPMYNMGMFDRALLPNNTDRFSTVLIRDGSERMTGSVEAVDRIFWFNSLSVIVEGALPTVSVDGVISWPATGAPPMGTMFTIEGSRYAEYFCWGDYPSDRNMHSGMQLPRRVVLRKFDLFGSETRSTA